MKFLQTLEFPTCKEGSEILDRFQSDIGDTKLGNYFCTSPDIL